MVVQSKSNLCLLVSQAYCNRYSVSVLGYKFSCSCLLNEWGISPLIYMESSFHISQIGLVLTMGNSPSHVSQHQQLGIQTCCTPTMSVLRMVLVELIINYNRQQQ